jgi:hypothetical protein
MTNAGKPRTIIARAYANDQVPSQYAQKNTREFVAESWAEYMNSPTPRPVAMEVGQLIEAEAARKAGSKATVENALILAALKGGPGSGNWGHTSETRRGVGRGGSDPGGGLVAIGARPESTPPERRAASQEARRGRNKPRGPTVPRFKTNQEAADWVKAQGLAEECLFNGLDLRGCQDIADSLAETAARIPAFRGRVRRIGSNRHLNERLRREKRAAIEQETEELFRDPRYDPAYKENYIKKRMLTLGVRMPPNTYALAYSRDVYLSQVWYGRSGRGGSKGYDNLKISTADDVKNGWLAPGTGTPRAMVDHEVGHLLDSQFRFIQGAGGMQLQDKMRAFSRAGQAPSTYARTNFDEFLAEAWSEYVNSPTPGPAAKEIGQYMERVANQGLPY